MANEEKHCGEISVELHPEVGAFGFDPKMNKIRSCYDDWNCIDCLFDQRARKNKSTCEGEKMKWLIEEGIKEQDRRTAWDEIFRGKVRKVNICGLYHRVVEVTDEFGADCHMGQINYKDLNIAINRNMPEDLKEATICHEMLHGMLTHLGYDNLSNDEQFVTALGNAIYQGFNIKYFREGV